MPFPPVVTDMPPAESKRVKMPSTVLAICILQGIFLLISAISFFIVFSQSHEELRNQFIERLDERLEYSVRAVPEQTIDRMIAVERIFFYIDLILASVSVILFIGLCYGNRLTRYFYRTIGLLLAILCSLRLYSLPMLVGTATVTGNPRMYISIFMILFYSLTSWYYYFALGTESARKFFSAICPRCRSKKIRLHNLFATEVSCKACGTEWT